MSDHIDTHNDFNPGPGWTEVPDDQTDNDTQVVLWWDGESWHRWIREQPVPPLPTEPYTVIRVQWRDLQDNDRELTLHPHPTWNGGEWVALENSWAHDDLQRLITDFEVLTVPFESHHLRELQETEERVRRETARAVLQDVHRMANDAWARGDLSDLYVKFGVEVDA